MSLYRLSGTGNTFVFANFCSRDNLQEFVKYFSDELNLTEKNIYSEEKLTGLAKILCSDRQSFGPTDGLVLISPALEADFRWDFINRDGSRAAMCGNAARCVGKFAIEEKLSKGDTKFVADKGIVECFRIDNDNFKIKLDPVKEIDLGLKIESRTDLDAIFNEVIHIDWLDSGVPHCVIHTSKNDWDFFKPLAQYLRGNEFFPPEGANITFVSKQDENEIYSVSFERGVENFTQACGTGAIAAAYSFNLLEKRELKPVFVNVPGGKLMVTFENGSPCLQGRVEYTHKIELTEVNKWKLK